MKKKRTCLFVVILITNYIHKTSLFIQFITQIYINLIFLYTLGQQQRLFIHITTLFVQSQHIYPLYSLRYITITHIIFILFTTYTLHITNCRENIDKYPSYLIFIHHLSLQFAIITTYPYPSRHWY